MRPGAGAWVDEVERGIQLATRPVVRTAPRGRSPTHADGAQRHASDTSQSLVTLKSKEVILMWRTFGASVAM